MGKLSDLPNISNVLENELIEVGIHSPEELQAIGTENAFIQIMAINETAVQINFTPLKEQFRVFDGIIFRLTGRQNFGNFLE